MKLNDVASLAGAPVTETLTTSLPCNLLDDRRCVLATAQDNVDHVDRPLANKIADRGVKALAKLLNERSVVLSLNLHDNHIHADGGTLGARSSSTGARSPRLLRPTSPNFLRPFLRSCCRTSTSGSPAGRRGRQAPPRGPVREPDAHAAQPLVQRMEFDAATTTRQIVATSTALRNLDLSCNLLSEEAGRLREGLQQNGTLQSLDLRQNQMSLDTVAAVDEVQAQPARVRQAAARRAREAASARRANTAGAPAYA